MRRRTATPISLRSRRGAAPSGCPRLDVKELGPRAGKANRHATGQSCSRAQARGHYAPDLERSQRIPLDGYTAVGRLRTMRGQELTEIRRTWPVARPAGTRHGNPAFFAATPLTSSIAHVP